MNRRAIQTLKKRRSANRGQVALEYALGVVIVAGLASLLFVFYQGFVQANLYGHAGEFNNALFGLGSEYKAIGLERVASMPVP